MPSDRAWSTERIGSSFPLTKIRVRCAASAYRIDSRSTACRGHPAPLAHAAPNLSPNSAPIALGAWLHRGVEELGAVVGRGAVDVDDEIFVAVVRSLKRCARLDVDEPTGGHVVTLRRVAEVHR